MDSTGAKFCYVSGDSLKACRDVQQSQYRRDLENGRRMFLSYEACTIPSRNQCFQYQNNNRNCGDGDYNQANGGVGTYPDRGGNPSNARYPNNGGYPNNNNNC